MYNMGTQRGSWATLCTFYNFVHSARTLTKMFPQKGGLVNKRMEMVNVMKGQQPNQ